MYFLSYGTKPFQEDSFLRYNQPRTVCTRPCARVPLPRQELFFRLSLSPSPLHLFSSSSPLLSFRFFHPPPLNARREIHDMHCFLQEKQWGRFCANDDDVGGRDEARGDEARRGEAPVSRLRRQPSESKTNVLAITAFVAEQQPFLPPPSSCPEKLERNWRIRLFDRNARRRAPLRRRGERDSKGRLEKKTREKTRFHPRKRNIIHEWVYEWKQRFAVLIGFRIGSELKAMNISFRGSSDFERRRTRRSSIDGTISETAFVVRKISISTPKQTIFMKWC